MFENKNLTSLVPYKLSSHKAWELENSSNILKLDWNEATISPSPSVFLAIKKALNMNHLNWYPNTNNASLKAKISEYTNIGSDYIQYFASSDSLHEYIIQTFLNNDNKVMIISPTYDNFRVVVESSGGIIKYYPLDENFNLDFNLLSINLNKIKPKLLYLVNPNNPTGTQYKIEDIESLIKEHKDILFIIDEAYYEFSGLTCSKLCLEYKNIIISRTFSKAFALASFRIGFAISCKENILSLNKVRNPKNVSLLAQVAAEAALGDLDYTLRYVKEVNKAKNEFYEFLILFKWTQVYKGKGNFLFLKIDTAKRKKELKVFLEKNKVFIRDYGHLLNTKEYLRISIGTSEQMNIVKEYINRFNESYK